MTNNDIYSRLLAGESMEDIMGDLTAQANEAQARYDEFKRLEEERVAAEQAAKQAEALRIERETAKRESMIDIINAMLYYIAEYYPALGYTVEDIDNTDDATIYALADLALMALDIEVAQKTRKSLHTTLTFPFRAKDSKIEAAKTAEPAKPTADDVFASFFKTFM